MKYGCEIEESIARVVRLLEKSKSILFITGAGISADSGLPTYRGIGGLYNDATTEEGVPIETALAGETLQRCPQLTWKYLSRIEEKCRGVTFNRAHQVIAEMEEHFERVWVLTQNIDGFHKEAGSRNVIEIHGNMHKLFCPQCLWRMNVRDYSTLSIPPMCPECQAIVRPEVVFFGEMLPLDKLNTLSRQLQRGFDLYFSVGTSSLFPYIQQPIIDAQEKNLPTIEINPAQTPVSALVEVRIPLRSAEALEMIWQQYQKERGGN